MRITSLQAYEKLLETGKLSKRRLEALQLLIEFGPGTAQELCRYSKTPGLWKRYSELDRLGYARAIKVRACEVTGYQAIVWQDRLGGEQGELF